MCSTRCLGGIAYKSLSLHLEAILGFCSAKTDNSHTASLSCLCLRLSLGRFLRVGDGLQFFQAGGRDLVWQNRELEHHEEKDSE